MNAIKISQVSFAIDTLISPDPELISTMQDYFKHPAWKRDIYPTPIGLGWFFHTDSPFTLVQAQHRLAELYDRIKWFKDVVELSLRFVTERGDKSVQRFLFRPPDEPTTSCSQLNEKIDEGREEGK